MAEESEGADLSQIRLKLKDGTEVLAQRAYVQWQVLERFQQKFPVEFHLLLLLAKNELPPLPLHVYQGLCRGDGRLDRTFFGKNGMVEEETRHLLVSAYRETSEGAMLVNPFELSTIEERQALDRIGRRVRQLRRRFPNGDVFPDEGHSL